MNEKVRKLLVDAGGEILLVEASKDEPIETILKNGEMAHISWYKQGKTEYNGKYVIKIEYF